MPVRHELSRVRQSLHRFQGGSPSHLTADALCLSYQLEFADKCPDQRRPLEHTTGRTRGLPF
jgi:hypothetical protein